MIFAGVSEKGCSFLSTLTKNVSLIDTMALGEARVVAAYLVTGKETALIDMGYRSSAETVISDLVNAGIGKIDYLLPTHVHLDHAGSCGTLVKRFSEAAVRAHPAGVKHLVDPTQLIEGASELFEEELMHRYGLPEPVDAKRVSSLNDDESIHLGNKLTLRSVWTPGHASHHLSFQLEPTRMIFTGDSVGIYYPDAPVLVPTTPPSFNFDKVLASLTRIRGLMPSALCTPHFGIVNDAIAWLDANEHALLEWKATIERLLADGKQAQLIVKDLTEIVSQQLHRLPTNLPAHLRTLIRVDVIGFLRWLEYSKAEQRAPR